MTLKKTTYLLFISIIASALLVTCKEDKLVELPTVSTIEATEITINSAKTGGNITNDGGSVIVSRGVVWSNSQNPSIELNIGSTSDETGSGTFQSNIMGLTPNTVYFIRAYAENSAGIAYGNQISFSTGILPRADFNATPTAGYAPLTVNFLDQSANNPTIWEWDFGDGNVSTQQNPVHIYQNAGSYTVQLTVSNSYGSDIEIKDEYIIVDPNDGDPCPGMHTVTDIDGNLYNTVFIGGQCWMKENLKTTRYANGKQIDYPDTDNTAWGSNTDGAYTWHHNDTSWKDLYGALYNWHAVNNVYGLCPIGWHVPSDTEWAQLIDYVVAQGYPNHINNKNGAGNSLKSCRQVGTSMVGECNTTEHPRWNSTSIHHGFDEFHYSALPGGYRFTNGNFYMFGLYGMWWSNTEHSPSQAWSRSIYHNQGDVLRYANNKTAGFSVRCLKD